MSLKLPSKKKFSAFISIYHPQLRPTYALDTSPKKSKHVLNSDTRSNRLPTLATRTFRLKYWTPPVGHRGEFASPVTRKLEVWGHLKKREISSARKSEKFTTDRCCLSIDCVCLFLFVARRKIWTFFKEIFKDFLRFSESLPSPLLYSATVALQ